MEPGVDRAGLHGPVNTWFGPAELLRHLRAESDRFAAAADLVLPTASVPSCPGWAARDLVVHLTEVQQFWADVVLGRRQSAPDVPPVAQQDSPVAQQDPPAARPDTPAGRQDQPAYSDTVAHFRWVSDGFARLLASAPPDTPVWAWWHHDRTVAAVIRRMTHEALIHRLDADLAGGRVTPVDPHLADDGVDEVLMRFLSLAPPWSVVTSTQSTGRIRCTDTGSEWDVTPARWSGTSPSTGRGWDEPLLIVDPLAGAHQPAFTVTGTARDLDAWLWGRPPLDTLAQQGDPVALALLTEVVEQGIG